MNWSLKDHGDALEREAYGYIQTKLTAYEQIWSVFIGHRGNGTMASLIPLGILDEKARIKFSQNHYTILESLYFMHKIYEKEKGLNNVFSIDGYRDSIVNVIGFMSLGGRLIDCMVRCFEIYLNGRSDEAKARLRAVYEARHIAIHGVKFPVVIDSGLFMMPEFNENHGWHQGRSWDELNCLNTMHVSEFFEDIMCKLESAANSLLYELLARIKQILAESDVTLESPMDSYKLKANNLGFVVSGSSFDIDGKVCVPPSGIMFYGEDH